MGYILFLVIGTWVALFYAYCKFKELNDKVEFFHSKIDTLQIDRSDDLSKIKEQHQETIDSYKEVILNSIGYNDKKLHDFQEILDKYQKKILTLEKKTKKPKPKKETKKVIPKVVSKT